MSEETWIAGRFRLEQELGSGAFGEAHVAQDQETGEQVVLKLLHAEHAERADLVERFRREIRALERVIHPCVPALIASGTEADGRMWYASEYCPGSDLYQVLRADPGPWPVARAARVMDDLMGALAAAHGKGVLHRDLKPANLILVDDHGQERIKLIDFGVAKLLDGGARTMIDLTQGQALGTPFYLSPEQAEGSPVDARTDLYSAGVILFELLTGARPFEGDTVQSIITAVLREAPPTVRDLRPELPKPLEALVTTLLRKDPGQRPGSAQEVRALLRKALPAVFDTSGTSREIKETAATMLPAHVLAAARTEDLAPDPDPYRGQTIAGLYRLDHLLGKGGFGRVYRARHLELDVDVALKVMPAGDPEDQPKVLADTYERFKREALAMRSFVHKHAVQVRNFGRDEERRLLFLELDYLEGDTLDGVLRREGPLPEERALRIGRQVLSALAEAHSRGLVHRDLKPANIMLVEEHGEESARLLDFGIVKLVGALEDTTDLTGKGVAIGTVHYMSPEQAGGDVVDLPSDVYSMAVVLYLCLSGQLPIEGGKHPTQASMRARIMTKPPRPLRELAPHVSKPTAAAVMQALEKAPADRFPDAGEFLEALGGEVPLSLSQSRGGTSRVGPAPEQPRQGVPWALVLVGLLLALGVGALATQPALRERLLGSAGANDTPAAQTAAKTAAAKTEAARTEAIRPPDPTGSPSPTPSPKASPSPSPTPVNPPGGKAVPAWWKAEAPARRPALPLPQGIAFRGERGTYLNERDGSVLVYVAGDATSSPFFIGKTEVTWAQWAKLGVPGPRRPSWAADDHPAVNVSYADAQAYAKRAGARLPTTAEWTRAAGDGKYPWGDAPAARQGRWRLNCRGDSDGYASTAPVGSFPTGRSPAGCLDMAGNAAEWTLNDDGQGVLKGGAFTSVLARCAVQAPTMGLEPTIRRTFVGLRIMRSVDGN